MNWPDWIVPTPCLVDSGSLYVFIALCATFLIGVSKGGFGAGTGLLATPLLLMVLPGNVALSVQLPILIACDAFTLRHFPRDWERRSLLLLIPGTILGLGIGLGALLWFARENVNGDPWIRLVVGIVALAFCVLQWIPSRNGSNSLFRPGPRLGHLVGLLSGFTTMVAHAAGPLVTMFLLPQGLDRKRFVGTCARYFLGLNISKLPLYFLATFLASKTHYLTRQTLLWDLWLLPFCPIAVALGAWLNRRVSARVFTIVIYVFLFITGLQMIVKSVGVFLR